MVLEQQPGVGRVRKRDDRVPGYFKPGKGLLHLFTHCRGIKLPQRLGAGEARQIGTACGQYVFRKPELGQQLTERCGTESRREGELQPARQTRIGAHAGDVERMSCLWILYKILS